MGFRSDAATLARLEWPRLTEILANCASTARGGQACRGGIFQPTRAAVLERLAETAEARALLDAAEPIAFRGVADLRPGLELLGRGSRLGLGELAEVFATIQAAQRLASFFRARAVQAPQLADLASILPDLSALANEIGRVITPEGELRDDASPELRRASRRIRDLERKIEARMAEILRDQGIQPHLQDRYVTSRENRPVLPVRADARQRVRGIVHDVSSSGTTLFIEPEAVIELGNLLRVAQTERERETERLLRALSDAARNELTELDAMGDTLEVLDMAAARGQLSARLDACAPDAAADSGLELRGLRHPLLLLEAGLSRDDVVPNDLVLGDAARGLIISGPNAGGKTVAAKAVGLAALCVRAGLHVPCAEGSRLPIFDAVFADIGDEQDLRSGLSTFSARMANLARALRDADSRTLAIVDEIGEGTEPGEGAALAQAVLEALVERGAIVIATTHFNRLKELAGVDARFENASAEFDSATLLPTYRIGLGAPGSSGASWVAARMGLEDAVIERAQALMDAEDRKLEALTRGLSELRQELLAEQTRATRVREETETTRDEVKARLAALRGAREQALTAMKADLETAYRQAGEEIAEVMRSIQRKGADAGRAANLARERLHDIRESTAAVESAERMQSSEASPQIDWSTLKAGDRLELEGISSEATLVTPPDSRGRITVRIGGVRSSLPSERVRRVMQGPPPAATTRAAIVEVERAPLADAGHSECDLRGLRVDEALERADAYLQQMLGRSAATITFIHGHGTGALRSAVRAWLRDLPEVAEFAPAPANAGGNGATVATLTH